MASGVTPKQIYTALTGAGASTTQAIGIMANMIAESGLDPEAVGDQGTSFGTVQQHGMQYANLVTGNPSQDLAAQIKVLAQNGGIGAAAGSTGAQAAGNFAANYERCVGCEQGGDQYNQRVANAATVAGWVSSGNWPASAGSASAAAGTGSAASSGSGNNTSPECAFGTGAINFHVGSIPAICLVKKTTIRHVVGGLIIGGGTGILLVGSIILAATAFNKTPAAPIAKKIVAKQRASKRSGEAERRRLAPSQSSSVTQPVPGGKQTTRNTVRNGIQTTRVTTRTKGASSTTVTKRRVP